MSVTATFQPDRVNAAPGQTAALALHLHNASAAERVVTLRAGGELAGRTVLQTETVFLDPDEHLDVPIVFDANAELGAGDHPCVIDVVDGDSTSTIAATVAIDSSEAWSARLEPQMSRSGGSGRHKVVIDNTGNVPVLVEMAATTEDGVVAEIAAPAVNIDPAKTAKVEFRITPPTKFWSGQVIEHPFTLMLSGSDAEVVELDGVFEQGPRIRPWVWPAVAGMIGALLLGALAWFTLLRPYVEDTARTEATALDAEQQAALDDRVVAIQEAAEEASELPLGQPTDLRLDATAAPSVTSTRAFDFDASGSGRTLSITDVIFQNPTGAVGRVELLRDDMVLLDQEMANFRDLDFHFVAPLTVDSGSSIALRVTCTTPGPGTDECAVAATVVGYVDAS